MAGQNSKRVVELVPCSFLMAGENSKRVSGKDGIMEAKTRTFYFYNPLYIELYTKVHTYVSMIPYFSYTNLCTKFY